MKEWLKKIQNDVFDIGDRLKGIDDGYFVVYNKIKHRYEVHNSNQKDDTLCFVVPYKSLDSRTVDLCLSSRRQNADKLFEEIDRHNRECERNLVKQCQNNAQENLERMKEIL